MMLVSGLLESKPQTFQSTIVGDAFWRTAGGKSMGANRRKNNVFVDQKGDKRMQIYRC